MSAASAGLRRNSRRASAGPAAGRGVSIVNAPANSRARSCLITASCRWMRGLLSSALLSGQLADAVAIHGGLPCAQTLAGVAQPLPNFRVGMYQAVHHSCRKGGLRAAAISLAAAVSSRFLASAIYDSGTWAQSICWLQRNRITRSSSSGTSARRGSVELPKIPAVTIDPVTLLVTSC